MTHADDPFSDTTFGPSSGGNAPRPRRRPGLCCLLLVAISLLGVLGCASRRQEAVAEPEPLAARQLEATPGAEGPAKPPPRDWSACPAIAEIGAAGDIWVVGDVHGDHDRLQTLLEKGGLIGEGPRPEWQAGDAKLVFVGDFTGKGDQSVPVIRLIRRLDDQAKRVGGRVIAAMGNHEAEFLAGEPWPDKTEEFRTELGATISPQECVRNPRSHEDCQFLHCLPIAARSDRWFFAHAGGTGGRNLADLEAGIRAGVDGPLTYRAGILLDKETGLLDARLTKKADRRQGKVNWWERPDEDREDSEERLRSWVRNLGVEHMAIGHQAGKRRFNKGIKREKGHLFQLFDGTLHLMDVGMGEIAKDFSHGALLHIRRGEGSSTVEVVCADGKRHPFPPGGTSKGVDCP